MRGDPVPVHEQVRAQRRAVAAGVVLGVLGLVAALVVGGRRSAPRVADAGPGGRPGRRARCTSSRTIRTGWCPSRTPCRGTARARRPAVGSGAHGPGARRRRGARRGAAHPGGRRRRSGGRGSAAARLGPPGRCATRSRPRRMPVGTTVLAGRCPVGGAEPASLIAVPGGDTWLVAGGHRHRVDLDDGPVADRARAHRPRSPARVARAWSRPCPREPPLVTTGRARAGAAGPLGLRRRASVTCS